MAISVKRPYELLTVLNWVSAESLRLGEDGYSISQKSRSWLMPHVAVCLSHNVTRYESDRAMNL